MLEFELGETRGARHLLLRVDCGEGFDPALFVTLPLRRGKIAKRICYFPVRVRALELEIVSFGGAEQKEDDARSSLKLEVEHCCLAWLAPYFARDRLCQRLANMHRNYRGQSIRDVRKSIRSEATAKARGWRSLALIYYSETFHKRCPDAGYAEWLAQVEAEQLPCGAEVPAFTEALPSPPEFLLRLRLSAETVDYAWHGLRSILAQSYPHWRLVIEVFPSLRTASPSEFTRFESAAREDARVVIAESGTLGSDLPVTGESGQCYASELPAWGRLHIHALFFAAKEIVRKPEAKLLYTDADTVNRAGVREAPLFKPGWNPDLLLAYNYVGQCCFFRADLLQRWDCSFPEDNAVPVYGRLLRCRDELTAEEVAHLPRVVYHQRSLPEAELEALCAEEQKALQKYLQGEEREPLASVEDWKGCGVLSASIARCQWPLPNPEPLVSLLIPTRDGIEILRQCVDSILQKTDYPNFEVLILDNQSRCPETLIYLEAVQSDKRVRVRRWDHPFNYSAINNFGATLARGSILGLINNDIEVISAGWLTEMVSHACRAEIGCVGAKLYYGNDTVQHGGVILGIGGAAGHSHKYALRDTAGYMGRLQVVQNLSAVTGACMLLRKTVFEEVGGLNEVDLPIAYNDVDLCLKVREVGYRNLWTPHAELYHHESVSRGADDTAAKRRRAQREVEYMRKRWGELLDSDPAYNPNLTLVHEDFSLA